MQLDRLALRLRRRRPWEAIDLGCRMAQAWWRPLMAAWLTAYLPVAIVLYIVFSANAMMAILVLWWLKPLFDRVALEVLSRAIFGESPTPLTVLRALRDSRGLLSSLTIRRFDFARSFNMPIWHLERLSGKAARERARSLQRRGRGPAVWATVVFFHFELVVTLAFFGAIDLFTPGEYEAAFGLRTLFSGDDASAWRQVLTAVLQVTTVSLIEPFYVAGGFALYLNRRTQLEAWDLELTLRNIARTEPKRPRAVAAVLLSALVLALASPPHAVAAARDPESVVKQVLADPEFEQYRDTTDYRLRNRQERAETPDAPSALGAAIANIGRILMWIAAVALVGLLLYHARRYVGAWAPERSSRRSAPAVLFGLDVTPESLPPDIAAAALRAIDDGRAREALGLLYRGALSALVTRDGLEVEAGDTEGDCVRRTRALVDADKADVFASLVRAWQATAYAQRPPREAALRDLLDAWRPHFGAPGR